MRAYIGSGCLRLLFLIEIRYLRQASTSAAPSRRHSHDLPWLRGALRQRRPGRAGYLLADGEPWSRRPRVSVRVERFSTSPESSSPERTAACPPAGPDIRPIDG